MKDLFLSIMWFAIAFYMLAIILKLKKIEKKIDELKKKEDEQ